MPASVLVVDDMALYRMVIARAVQACPELILAGQVGSGAEALEAIQRLRPDLVSLDLEMPGMSGIDVLRALRALPAGSHHPTVVVFSAQSREGAAITLEALALGAADFVLKPTAAEGADAISQRLVPKLQALAPRGAPTTPRTTPALAQSALIQSRQALTMRRVLAIASSTGGPLALEKALVPFPRTFPSPILIVQHMPPVFTATLAERLAKVCQVPVAEARDGMPLKPGHGYLAPGDFHLEVAGERTAPVVKLTKGDPVYGLRPAADVTFRSLEPLFREQVVCAVFTGMGRDGADGCKALSAYQVPVLTQTAASCVVYGMPQAVDELGLASGHFAPDGFYQAVSAYRFTW